MTVGIYIRVSTIEQVQEGYSIAAQRERLTSYCKAQGWDDFKFYVDEGISAKDTNRPSLQMLLDHVKEGAIKTILVYRLDRFTRSVMDLYDMLELLDKHECSFKSATEVYDTSSAMGRMFIGLVALMAQWERENLSERVKMGLSEKVRQGERAGLAPYGFKTVDGRLIEDEEQGPVLRYIVKQVISGKSSNQIVKHLNETGVKPLTKRAKRWHINSFLYALKNPALYGATFWQDQIIEDTHEGIISKTEFNLVQQKLSDRSVVHKRGSTDAAIFQSVITCPLCKSILHTNKVPSKGVDYFSYRCGNCRINNDIHTTYGEKRIEKALLKYMQNMKIVEHQITVNKEINISQAQLESVERQREKYQHAWANDLISDEEFTKHMQQTKNTYEELKKQVAEVKPAAAIDVNKLKRIKMTFNDHFKKLNKEEKKEFVSTFIRKIEIETFEVEPARKRNAYALDELRVKAVIFY